MEDGLGKVSELGNYAGFDSGSGARILVGGGLGGVVWKLSELGYNEGFIFCDVIEGGLVVAWEVFFGWVLGL